MKGSLLTLIGSVFLWAMAATASAESLVGASITLVYPGQPGDTISSPGYPGRVGVSQFLFNSGSGQPIGAVANATITGNLFSQSQIGSGGTAGLYEANSSLTYTATFTPTTTGPLSVTFHLLPQTLQVLSNSISTATIQSVIGINSGDTLYAALETLTNTGNGIDASQLSPIFTETNGVWSAPAMDLTFIIDGVAGQEILLEYNIFTRATATIEDAIALTAFNTPQVLAQFGDPFDINTPPNPQGNNANVQFGPAVAEVPEPTSLLTALMLGLSAGASGWWYRRRS